MKLTQPQFNLAIFYPALLALALFFYTPTTLTHAQTPCTQSGLNQGLISAASKTGSGTIGNTDQTCVLDPKAAYQEFKIPKYSDLENEFYSLSRSTAKVSDQLPNGAIVLNGDGIYRQSSGMDISSFTGSGVQVIFVRGNLRLTGNINYPGNPSEDSTSGLVFVVSGDIYIDYQVTQVNAVLISSGIICTAYDSAATPPCLEGQIDTPKLVVNGSLISINKLDLPDTITGVRLGRNLANNIEAAEVINKQPKFLYLLRNGLFTKDLILTEEDKSYFIGADLSPPLPSTPPPAPVCPGATNPLSIPKASTSVNWISIPNTCVVSIFDS